MFSLIVTVISIFLVIGVAYATMSFTGSAFLGSKAEAEASTYINEGQQLVAAIRMYQTDHYGELPQHLENQLVGDNGRYLKSMPQSTMHWNLQEGAVQKPMENEDACREVNLKAGIPEADADPKFCDEPHDGYPYYCCLPPGEEV